MEKRRFFHDNKLQKKYERDGYVTIKLLSNQQIRHLIEFHNQTHGNIEALPGYYNTADDMDVATKYRVRDEFQNVFSPLLNAIVVDYKIVFCNYNVKKSGEGSKMFLHQDYSYADEDKYTTLNAWSPLVNLQLDNSYLGIVKGSYKFVNSVHGRNMGTKYGNINGYIADNFTDKLLIDAGSVVIWHHSMLHHSPVNTSGKLRIALSNIMIPKEADVVQYILEPEEPKVMKAYKVDENFLVDVPTNGAIIGKECIKRQPYDRSPVNEAEFEHEYKKANTSNILSRILNSVK